MTEVEWWSLLVPPFQVAAPALIQCAPFAGDAWLGFADWLEEQGDDRSHAARIIHQHQWSPMQVQLVKTRCAWGNLDECHSLHPDLLVGALPRPLFDRLHKWSDGDLPWIRSYGHAHMAYGYLFRALREMP